MTTNFEDLGDGVLYLHVYNVAPGGAYFAKNLAQYLKENPDRNVKSVSSYEVSGSTVSYTVVT